MAGQSARVPPQVAGERLSGDTPQVPSNPPALSDEPTDYKGISLAKIGYDASGKVIPHKRSEKIARQIKTWVAGGYDFNAICIALNLRPGLVKRHYTTEIQMGLDLIGMEMTSHIVARAKKSDRMAIFFAKARMGWRDGESAKVDTGVLNIHMHT